MLVEHTMALCETGEMKRVSWLRECIDGLVAQADGEIMAGAFTAKRRELFVKAVLAGLDYAEIVARQTIKAPTSPGETASPPASPNPNPGSAPRGAR